MKRAFEFIKRSFMSGLYIVVPLTLLIFLGNTVIEFLVVIISPITELLPSGAIFGMGMTKLSALAILLAATVVIGIFNRGKRERRIINKIEKIIPGYSVIKKFIQTGDDERKIKSCLATIDDAWLFAFILEEKAEGMLTIFVPSAPIPTSGNIYFMTEQQVKRLDIPPKEVIQCITQMGMGAQNLLDGKVKW